LKHSAKSRALAIARLRDHGKPHSWNARPAGPWDRAVRKAAGGGVDNGGADDWTIPDAPASLSSSAPALSADRSAGDDWIIPHETGKSKPSALTEAALHGPARFNSAVATFAGLPVDAATWAVNKGIQGVNALAGHPVANTLGDLPGGSESIKRGMGALNINTDNLPPAQTTLGQLSGAAGEGAGMMVGPEAALGAAGRAGLSLAPRVMDAARGIFGSAESLPSMATNALVGAGGGAAGQAAEDWVPEPYKPLANMAGNLVGGGMTAAAGVGGRKGIEAAIDAGSYYARPFTEAGREAAAADTLGSRSTSREALRDTLDNLPDETVSGSRPTTFQATGDMGLGALERETATQNPAEFMQRRAEQNAARLEALHGLEAGGSPADVSNALRQQFHSLDEMTADAVGRSTDQATGQAEALGGHGTTEGYGASLRDSAAQARAAAKQDERALWRAVDPDNSLVLPVASVKQSAAKVYGQVPATARPISGEEAAIRETVKALPPATKFADVAALRSRVSAAMRDELLSSGQSPAYARLSQLRGAIEGALSGAVEKTAAQDSKAVAAGRVDSSETMAGRLAQTIREGSSAPQVGGSVYTPSGRQVGVNYEVVPGSSLVTSHGRDMQTNPDYPAELQPRDRSRAASDIQVSHIARNLQPERLGPSASAGEGAPIVGPDNVVESGNARTMAIQRAHADNTPSSAAYREYLEAHGFSTSDIPDPVLIRRRTSTLAPGERQRLTEEANASPMLTMSASERAAADAKRLPDSALDSLHEGDINSVDNRNFVRSFLRTVAERGEEGSLVTNDGRLSLDGTRRIQNALLHAGYGDANLVARLAESGDDSIRGLGNALTDVAGEFAKLRRDIEAGHVSPGVDITPDILDAVRLVDRARSRGVPLSLVAGVKDAFNPTSPVTDLLLQGAYGHSLSDRLSRDRFASLLRDYVKEAKQQTTEARLFGEPASAIDILHAATARSGNAGRQEFSLGDSRQGHGAPGAERGRSNGASSGSRRASEGEQNAAVLEGATAPISNFDKAASERLAKANTATRERVQTFDKGPVGTVLRLAGMAGQYRSLNSAVPAQIFKRGPTGFEAVNAYRKAVGSATAMETLGDYAAASLRQAAMRPDGTLDPVRLNAWRKSHADALRAMPATAARFENAALATREIENVAAIRRDALDQYQRGALGAILGAHDSEDVTRTVGKILAQKDAVKSMRQLAAETKNDPAAREGLRRAVVDAISNRFISNTEAATTGQGLIRSDQFQTFIRNNRAALGQVFDDREIGSLQAIAQDLQRSNRSTVAVKVPGQSNTAQDQDALRSSIMSGLIRHGLHIASGIGLGVPTGFLGSAAGAVGGIVLSAMREAGMRRIDDLIREAMLDPELARRLLMKHAPGSKTQELSLANYLRRNAAATLFQNKSKQEN
jgi:ddrB-like ParB superfamily domain